MKLPERVRAALATRPRLWRWVGRIKGRLTGQSLPAGPIGRTLGVFASEARGVQFVQIGSNDADFGDPIIDFVLGHGWRGLMVEPVPYVFARLRARHGANPRLSFENCAIAGADGEQPFYMLEPLDAPPSPWYDQMGSFSRAHIEKHERFTPGLSAHIREIRVACLRLDSLLARHAIARVDLLHVDAEGYDFEVLKTLDFARVTPGLVLFEHGHLPRPQRAECLAFLEARGYRILHEGRDSLALHRGRQADWPATARLFDALAPE